MITVLAHGCGGSGTSPTAPPSPAAQVVVLRVEGGTALSLAGKSQLRAFALRRNAEVVPLTDGVQWTIRDGFIAISLGGLLTANGLGSSTATASYQTAEGFTLKAVFPVVVEAENAADEQLAASWTGNMTCTECEYVSGAGPGSCGVGATSPLAVTTALSGKQVTASANLFGYVTTGSLSGFVSTSGDLMLSGPLRIASEGAVMNIYVARLKVSGDDLAGTMTMDRSWISGFGPVLQREVYRVSAKRSS